jgi:hypothetical protein
MHHNLSKDIPKFDIELLFDEIGVLLDDNQYRDAISLVDMYHFYTRRHQVSVYFLFLLIAVSADPFRSLPVLMYPLSRFISSRTIPAWSHLFDPTHLTLPLDANTRQHRIDSWMPPICWVEPTFFAPFAKLSVFRLSLSRPPFLYHI